jgi:hypothetical protein
MFAQKGVHLRTAKRYPCGSMPPMEEEDYFGKKKERRVWI